MDPFYWRMMTRCFSIQVGFEFFFLQDQDVLKTLHVLLVLVSISEFFESSQNLVDQLDVEFLVR